MADIRVVAFALLLFFTYGTFLYLNASAEQEELSAQSINASEYDTPESSGFWSTITEIGQMNTDNPEIFFLNTMLFGTVAILLAFVGLRYLRGVG